MGRTKCASRRYLVYLVIQIRTGPLKTNVPLNEIFCIFVFCNAQYINALICCCMQQKSDSLGKLYEMDTCPDRRGWVERLLAFMEERRTPIAACPTISKQPLDLYRLYLHVRERGGFVEVCKVLSGRGACFNTRGAHFPSKQNTQLSTAN